jgi:hypothetical protein
MITLMFWFFPSRLGFPVVEMLLCLRATLWAHIRAKATSFRQDPKTGCPREGNFD